MKNIACFLPCRTGSKRVPSKNTMPFASYENGLIELKLKQLASVKEIDTIFLSTNDAKILDYAGDLELKNLVVHKRSEELCRCETLVEDLIRHAYELTANHAHILWTHVTSPFANAKLYSRAVSTYFTKLDEGYDSLMTTTPLQGFIWSESGPINYDNSVVKWPRTQDLNPLHELNCAVNLMSRANYARFSDRIGKKPYLMPMDRYSGHDIDWPEDFQAAKMLLNSGLVST